MFVIATFSNSFYSRRFVQLVLHFIISTLTRNKYCKLIEEGMHSTGRVSPVTGFVENINICMHLLRKILNLFTLMLDTGLEVIESRLEQLGHVQNMIMNLITGIPTPSCIQTVLFSRFFNS